MSDPEATLAAVRRILERMGYLYVDDELRPDPAGGPPTRWVVIDGSDHVAAEDADVLLDLLETAENPSQPEG